MLTIGNPLDYSFQDIQVAGSVDGTPPHPEKDWRIALQRFLTGIWSEDTAIMMRPHIFIDGLTLQYCPSKGGMYYMYGNQGHVPPDHESQNRVARKGKVIAVSMIDGASVEAGFMRFILNDEVTVLELHLDVNYKHEPESPLLKFSKTDNPEQFIMEVHHLPTNEEEARQRFGLLD